MAKKIEFVGVMTNNMAKFRAIICGLELGVMLGVSKIHLEGDSLIMINAIKSIFAPNWRIRKWLTPISKLINKLSEFNHNY